MSSSLLANFNNTLATLRVTCVRLRLGTGFQRARGMSSEISAARMKEVHEQLPDWLRHSKSSNIIFEEAEVEQVVMDHRVVVDLLEDY